MKYARATHPGMSRRAVATVALALLLAGCSQAGESGQASGVTDGSGATIDASLQATATTGVIRCIVVDDAINPLQGAMVLIAGNVSHTGPDGRCGRDGLPAGTTIVTASKVGHHAVQVPVEVVAAIDDPDLVRIVLAVDPATTPYTQEWKHDVHLACSTTWSSACGHPALQGGTADSSTVTMALDGRPLRIAVEAVWTSSQPLGDALMVVIGSGEPTSSNAADSRRGPSPVDLQITGMEATEMQLPQNGLFVRIFAAESVGGPVCVPPPAYMCVNGVGAAIQQDVELFVHAFHHWLPDTAWRFSVDGPPSP